MPERDEDFRRIGEVAEALAAVQRRYAAMAIRDSRDEPDRAIDALRRVTAVDDVAAEFSLRVMDEGSRKAFRARYDAARWAPLPGQNGKKEA